MRTAKLFMIIASARVYTPASSLAAYALASLLMGLNLFKIISIGNFFPLPIFSTVRVIAFTSSKPTSLSKCRLGEASPSSPPPAQTAAS